MMKINLLIILFSCLYWLSADAQTTNEPAEDENYKDTTNKTISKFGNYVSFGVGMSRDYGIGGVDILFSYSFAFKNHIFSYTHAGATSISFFNAPNQYYSSNYHALLAGQALRARNLLLSFSAGIAYTNMNLEYTTHTGAHIDPIYITRYYQKGFLSVPVEFKAFLLTYNAIGIGLHFSYDFVPHIQFSPLYSGVCVVIGRWNKPRCAGVRQSL